MMKRSPMLHSSRAIPIRFPGPLLAELSNALASQQARTRGKPLTISEFIRRAVERDLKHRERSNRGNRMRGAAGDRRGA